MTYPFLTPLASCHPGIEDTIFKFVSICSLGIAESAATKPRRYHPARADLATACASASTKGRLASLRTIEKRSKPRTQQTLFEPLETKHKRESTFERTSVTETQLQDQCHRDRAPPAGPPRSREVSSRARASSPRVPRFPPSQVPLTVNPTPRQSIVDSLFNAPPRL